jgi:hypothetical protein
VFPDHLQWRTRWPRILTNAPEQGKTPFRGLETGIYLFFYFWNRYAIDTQWKWA